MSKTDQWMPLYIADYAGDTLHLKRADHGSYLLLLMHYWRNGPLPNDPEMLADIAGMTMEEWEGLSGRKVRAFFTLEEDGFLHQKRIDRELARCAEVSAKRSAIGKKGVEAREANKRRDHFLPAMAASAAAESGPTEAIAYAIAYPEDDAGHMTATSTEKKEPLLRNGADAAQAKPKQAGLFPPAPKPPSPPGRDELWFEGVPIFARLIGKSLETESGRKRVSSAVGRLVRDSGNDYLRVLKAIRDADAQRPISPEDWIHAAVRRKPRLIVNNETDPDDPWGILAWCRTLPGVRQNTDPDDLKSGQFTYQGWIVDYVAREVAISCRFPVSARIDWRLLGEWLDAGCAGDHIIAKAREMAGRVDSVGTLAFFDQAMRQMAGTREVA